MSGSVSPDLLELLRCPRCKGRLREVDGERPALECPACRLRYAVRDGIPIMLLDQATQL
jgi:uncharacterized protein